MHRSLDTVVRGPENVSELISSVRARRVMPAASSPRITGLPVSIPIPSIAGTVRPIVHAGRSEAQIDRSLKLIGQGRPQRRDSLRRKNDDTDQHPAKGGRGSERFDALVHQFGQSLCKEHDRQHGNQQDEGAPTYAVPGSYRLLVVFSFWLDKNLRCRPL